MDEIENHFLNAQQRVEPMKELSIDNITYGVIQYRNFTANNQTFTNCIQIIGQSIRIQADPFEQMHQIIEAVRMQTSVSLE